MPIYPPEAPAPPVVLELGPIAGTSFTGALADLGWFDNELVRVKCFSTAPGLTVGFWDGTAWRDKNFDVLVGGVSLLFQKPTILTNRPELGVLQFEATLTNGRAVLSVTLRPGERGARCFLMTNVAATLGVRPNPTAAFVKTAERQRQTTAEANGLRIVTASARTWTQTAGTGEMSKTAATSFDFLISDEVAVLGAAIERMTAEQRTIEGPGAIEWFSFAETSVVERSTLQAQAGAASLRFVASGPTAGVYAEVTAGPRWTGDGSVWLRCTAARTVRVDWEWLPFFASHFVDVVLVANTWTQVVSPALLAAPEGTTTHRVLVQALNAISGDNFFVDTASLLLAASTVPAGDLAADLSAQYIGAVADVVRPFKG